MLTPHTNKTAKPPKCSRGAKPGPHQLSLWGSTARTISKTAKALDEHNQRDVAVLWTPAAKKMDLPAVQALEVRCKALVEAVSSGAAATHGKIRNAGLNHPADVAAYLALRELDDKGRREVPEHRLIVIDFGVSAITEHGR